MATLYTHATTHAHNTGAHIQHAHVRTHTHTRCTHDTAHTSHAHTRTGIMVIDRLFVRSTRCTLYGLRAPRPRPRGGVCANPARGNYACTAPLSGPVSHRPQRR